MSTFRRKDSIRAVFLTNTNTNIMKKFLTKTKVIILAILIGCLMIIDRIILVPLVWKDVPSIEEYSKYNFLVTEMMKRISFAVMTFVLFFGFYYLITWIF